MNAETISQVVNTKGFCCSTTFKEVIPGLNMIRLPLYVDVKFKGSFDMKPWRPKYGVYKATELTEVGNTINDWVRLLNYQYTPPTVTGKEETIDYTWTYIDYETLLNTMKFDVYVYYRKTPIENEKNYYVINENGYLVKLDWNQPEDEEEGWHSQQAWVPNLVYSNQQLEKQDNILVVPCN